MMRTNKPLSLTQELSQIDQRLLELLAERTVLLSKAASARRSKSLGITDPDQEKVLWSVWREVMTKENLEPQILRRIFHLTNNLSYARAEKSTPQRSLCLFPRRKPANIQLEAPRDQLLTSILFFLGATSSTPLQLTPCQTNELSLEFINALNLAGFSVAVDEEQCQTIPCQSWNLDNKVIYAGQCKFHFFLLLCLSLGRVTRVKFTGATKLKMLDLRPLQELLPRLGARLTSVEPHSNGVPVRLESSGQLPDTLEIPAGISRKFILALIVAATTFKKPLTLVLDPSYTNSKLFRKGISFLQEYCPSIAYDGGKVQIPGDEALCLVSRADVPMDPLLSLHLLVLPFFISGTVNLHGYWPGPSLHRQTVLDILHEFGLRMAIEDGQITSSMGTAPEQLSIDIQAVQEYLPMVLALAIGLRKECEILLDPARDDLAYALDFLDAFGIHYELEAGVLRLLLSLPRRKIDSPWVSPGPFWTLSAALASFSIPGVCLTNADNIVSTWPNFWDIFMNLPEPQQYLSSTRPQEELEENHERPRRKRIRLASE